MNIRKNISLLVTFSSIFCSLFTVPQANAVRYLLAVPRASAGFYTTHLATYQGVGAWRLGRIENPWDTKYQDLLVRSEGRTAEYLRSLTTTKRQLPYVKEFVQPFSMLADPWSELCAWRKLGTDLPKWRDFEFGLNLSAAFMRANDLGALKDGQVVTRLFTFQNMPQDEKEFIENPNVVGKVITVSRASSFSTQPLESLSKQEFLYSADTALVVNTLGSKSRVRALGLLGFSDEAECLAPVGTQIMVTRVATVPVARHGMYSTTKNIRVIYAQEISVDDFALELDAKVLGEKQPYEPAK